MEISKLNLGCGEYKKEGYINVDYLDHLHPDIVHDLNKIPYPFDTNTFDLIEANHVLEHLDNPFAIMKELHRVSKNNGIINIRIPHFSRGFSHPEHKRGFDVSFPLYFQETFQGGFMGVSFLLNKMRLNWFAQPYLKKSTLSSFQYYAGTIAGKIINFFANLSPNFCSRIWCFWVGGFEEIEYIFVTKK